MSCKNSENKVRIQKSSSVQEQCCVSKIENVWWLRLHGNTVYVGVVSLVRKVYNVQWDGDCEQAVPEPDTQAK